MATASEQPTQIQPRVPSPPSGGPGASPRDPRSVSPGGPGEPPVPPRRTGGGGGGGGGDHGGPGGTDGDRPNRTRLYSAIGLAIVLLAVIGVFAMGGGGEDDARVADSTPSQQTTPSATATPEAEATPAPTATAEPTATPEADDSAQATQPQEETGGIAVGGDGSTGDGADAADAEAESSAPLLTAGSVADLKVNQGDTVRFRVSSDTAEEVHVHGYDRKYEIGAGETQTIAFPANLTGIFEIEFEDSGTQIGELTVEP